ncbi:hypothetical protein NC652_011692 [Populus alba x Populus x berolinensis]|nr:hypothetical protein NC652_011692 [Populus alba x Populus x berolinensis]
MLRVWENCSKNTTYVGIPQYCLAEVTMKNFYLSAIGDETSSSIQPTTWCYLSEAVKACTLFSISIRLRARLLSSMSLNHKLPDLLYQVPSPKLSIYT